MAGTPRDVSSDRQTQSWTAMRCRRLLRPLQSRLAALRKLSSVSHIHDLSNLPSTTNNLSRKPKRRRESTEARIEAVELQKRKRRTYSQKGISMKDGGTSQTGKTRRNITSRRPLPDGLTSIATPLLQRTKSALEACHMGASRPFPVLADETRDEALAQSLGLLLEMRHELGEERHGICEGIMRSLAALLLSTSSRAFARAPKSLLSMCLRQIPGFLAKADEEEVLNAQKNRSLASFCLIRPSARIYDELEMLGSAGCGWKGLPTLVRAHALSMLKEATTIGFLPPSFARLLVHYCQLAGYPDDSWELAYALLQRNYPDPQNSQSTFKANDGLRPLAMLSRLSSRPANASHVFRTTSSLVKSRRLPVAWLSTRAFHFFWVLSADEILGECTSIHNLQHISTGITSLCLLCSQSDTHHSVHRPLQALMTVIGTIITMALIPGGSPGQKAKGSPAKESRTLVLSRVLHVFQEALLATRGRSSHEQAGDVLRLGIFFVTMSVDEFEPVRKSAARVEFSPATSQHLGVIAVSLTCCVARNWGKAVSMPPNQVYSWLFDQLELLQLPSIKNLRRNGAFMLARETNDLRDLLFAENEQPTVSTLDKMPSAPTTTRQSTFSGYRWEQGISEWVIASPVKLDKPLMPTKHVSEGCGYLRTFSTEAGSRTARQSLRDGEVEKRNPHGRQKQATERRAQTTCQEYPALILGSEGHEAPMKTTAQQETQVPTGYARNQPTGKAVSTSTRLCRKGGRPALADMQMSHRSPESEDELLC